MFKTDQPIKSGKEDMLNRAFFSKAIGEAILSYGFNDSISIGLYGEWGSGKTSVINMVLEHIKDVYSSGNGGKNNPPIIMNFNPWNFADQNQLISQFFLQLSTVLFKTDKSKKYQKLGRRITMYAGYFEPFGNFPVIGPTARAFQLLGNAIKRSGNIVEKNLSEQRGAISKELGKLGKKIIIVIDDIDRLNNIEIRQVFQLVKSLADFPNTIYLLSFDKNIVQRALKEVQQDSGLEYLEKIIQVPFEVPKILNSEVQKFLVYHLTDLIRDIPDSEFDKNYWASIYHSGLKDFFRNIRDVNRFMNVLKLVFYMLKDKVNIVDLFAIIAVQVICPPLYRVIKNNKDYFLNQAVSFKMDEAVKEQKKELNEKVLAEVSYPSPDILENFLKALFPQLVSIYSNMSFANSNEKEWKKTKRICSKDFFDVYFGLSLTENLLLSKEFEETLESAKDLKIFRENLLALIEGGNSLAFIDHLKDYMKDEDIPEQNIENIITALLDLGDFFPEGDSGFFSIETPWTMSHLIQKLSMRIKNGKNRSKIIEKAFRDSKTSIAVMCWLLNKNMSEHGEKDPKDEWSLNNRTINPESLKVLKQITESKIKEWANAGKLEKHEHLLYILYTWKDLADKDALNRFTVGLIQNDSGLIKFVKACLQKRTSYTYGDYARETWYIKLEHVKDFLDVDSIEPRVRKILESPGSKSLGEKERIGLQKFIDAIEGKDEDN